jgi:hypothetical protein
MKTIMTILGAFLFSAAIISLYLRVICAADGIIDLRDLLGLRAKT